MLALQYFTLNEGISLPQAASQSLQAAYAIIKFERLLSIFDNDLLQSPSGSRPGSLKYHDERKPANQELAAPLIT